MSVARLSALMAALDEIAEATFRDDQPRYRRAVTAAIEQGATPDQVVDAYGYGAHRRLRDTGEPPVSFNRSGDISW